jgi:UDP-N-acetylglucosamine--N-acetylmuramyl-(pentapeptide) pyrophosphoryl-undecaprenol N-acetylglucosamine transferase
MSVFVLMAGGTGGHLFPAMALAQELGRRGHEIHLMTDHRVAAYGDQFPARGIHVVPSATPSVRNPVKFAGASLKILRGVAVARGVLRSIKPVAVIGFGGYPIVPSFYAATMLRIPGILHEQNAVMGRANRALANRASRIALSFAKTQYAEPFAAKSVLTGNPVRDRVLVAASTPYPELDLSGPLNLVITGGSQGARAFSDFLPPAIAALPDALRQRLRIAQQCRPEDLDRVAEAYRQMKVNVDLQPFFADLPERMANSHLVVARAGATTIAELTVLGRPSILVPLPGALDADQKNNAALIDSAQAGWIVEQATISPPSLANRLASLFGDPATLSAAAAAAKSLGQPNAVERLANLVEDAGRGKTI